MLTFRSSLYKSSILHGSPGTIEALGFVFGFASSLPSHHLHIHFQVSCLPKKMGIPLKRLKKDGNPLKETFNIQYPPEGWFKVALKSYCLGVPILC